MVGVRVPGMVSEWDTWWLGSGSQGWCQNGTHGGWGQGWCQNGTHPCKKRLRIHINDDNYFIDQVIRVIHKETISQQGRILEFECRNYTNFK